MQLFLQKRTSCTSLFYLAIYLNNIYKNIIAFEASVRFVSNGAMSSKDIWGRRGNMETYIGNVFTKSQYLKINRTKGKENGLGKERWSWEENEGDYPCSWIDTAFKESLIAAGLSSQELHWEAGSPSSFLFLLVTLMVKIQEFSNRLDQSYPSNPCHPINSPPPFLL